jgi:hypothetical protein
MRAAGFGIAVIALVHVTAGVSLAAIDHVVPSPVNLQVQTSDSRVSLSWQAGGETAPEWFRIEAGSAPGLTDRAIINVPWGAHQGLAAQFAASGVAPGVYYLRIRATANSITSDASNEVMVRVGQSGCPIPDAPRNVISHVQSSVVTLAWEGPPPESARAAGYVIEAGSTPGVPNVAIIALIESTQLSVSAPPGRYFVRMRSLGLCGSSEPSPEVQVIVPPAP